MPRTTESHDLALDFAHQYQEMTGELPIVVGLELYEYFGEWVKIVDARDQAIDVTVEQRFGERTRVEPSELVLKQRRK